LHAQPQTQRDADPSRTTGTLKVGESHDRIRSEPKRAAAPSLPAATAAPPRAPAPTASDWFTRGNQFAASGDYQRAALAYERGLSVAPDNPALHLALGRALAHLPSKRGRAEEVLRKAVELAPFSSRPYTELGLLYQAAGRKDVARKFLEKALSIKPNDILARKTLDELDGDSKSGGLLKKLFQTE
jgi:Flp pilus assembly protein TadD